MGARPHTCPLQRRGQPWHVFWTAQNRTSRGALDQARHIGPAQMVVESLANLELSLEADAWVCTLFSNWCMLIDELRMTIGGKAASPYVNVVDKTHRWGQSCFTDNFRRCYTVY